MKNSGFTLIELLIVIAIIGILAAVLIPSLLNSQRKVYDIAATSCAKSIQTAQGMAQIDSRVYLPIAAGPVGINRSTDGIDQACRDSNIYVVDRSSGNWASEYTIDVWDGRGSAVFTITPTGFQRNAAGATPFANTGNNLP